MKIFTWLKDFATNVVINVAINVATKASVQFIIIELDLNIGPENDLS